MAVMPLVSERVKETTTTTGTGAITLLGAVSGFVSFAGAFANPSTVYYAIVGPTTEWEVGVGTFTTTLARTTVLASSNAGAAVTFSAGTKSVFSTISAAFINATITQGTAYDDTGAPTTWAGATSQGVRNFAVVDEYGKMDRVRGSDGTGAGTILIGYSDTIDRLTLGDIALDIFALTNASGARDLFSVRPGIDVLAYDAGVQSLAALPTAADKIAYSTAADVWAEAPITSFGRSLIDDADGAAGRSTLGVVIGTNVQAWDADLDALAALSSTGIARRTGSNTWTVGTLVSSAELRDSVGVSLVGRSANSTGVVADIVASADLQYLARRGGALTFAAIAAADLPVATSSAYGAIRLGTEVPNRIMLSADQSESATVLTAVTDLTFTPAASSVYIVEVFGVFTAGAGTTGLTWNINPGNGAGALSLVTRGASAAATVVLYGSTGGTGVNGTTSGTGETPFNGFAIITTTGSPTAIQVYFATEINTSAVTLKGGRCFMRWTKLS